MINAVKQWLEKVLKCARSTNKKKISLRPAK
jgi:hypothetical protein